MPEYVTREEHEAVIGRIDAEDNRQNHRLDKLEATVENIAKLTIAVEKLAVSMDKMAKEQEKMTGRIAKLEAEPGENWHKAVWIVLTALIGAAVGYFLH